MAGVAPRGAAAGLLRLLLLRGARRPPQLLLLRRLPGARPPPPPRPGAGGGCGPARPTKGRGKGKAKVPPMLGCRLTPIPRGQYRPPPPMNALRSAGPLCRPPPPPPPRPSASCSNPCGSDEDEDDPCGGGDGWKDWCQRKGLPFVVAGLLAVGGLSMLALYKLGWLDWLMDWAADLPGFGWLRSKVGDVPGLGGLLGSSGVGSGRRAQIRERFPPTAEGLPADVPYLLVGAGTASYSALRAILGEDPDAKVLIVGDESAFPYMRPPLSKDLWDSPAGQAPERISFRQKNGGTRSLYYEPESFWVDPSKLGARGGGAAAVARGWNVNKLDLGSRQAHLDDGHVVKYERCLIATGASPRNLLLFERASPGVQDKVTLLRDVYDYVELREGLQDGKRDVLVVGGGLVGSELAAALARLGRKRGFQVFHAFPEGGVMAQLLPRYLSCWATQVLRDQGVEVLPKATVTDAAAVGDGLAVQLSSGDRLCVGRVVVAVGAEPNVHVARATGLRCDFKSGGVSVNAELKAGDCVWAAGDCVSYADPLLGQRSVGHYDHAVESGKVAGENMAGAGKPYAYQPMFWSDLGPDVGFEAVGIVDASLPTVGVFAKEGSSALAQPAGDGDGDGDDEGGDESAEQFNRGVVFYLRGETVVGVVLWNVSDRVELAREIICRSTQYSELNQAVRQLCIHEK